MRIKQEHAEVTEIDDEENITAKTAKTAKGTRRSRDRNVRIAPPYLPRGGGY
jgi:hypothetical protein